MHLPAVIKRAAFVKATDCRAEPGSRVCVPLTAWIGGPRTVHARPMASLAWGLARRKPGQRSPWRLTRRLAGFVLRPVGGTAAQAEARLA